jgi:fatty acid desaturase
MKNKEIKIMTTNSKIKLAQVIRVFAIIAAILVALIVGGADVITVPSFIIGIATILVMFYAVILTTQYISAKED